ncbi:MAG TPA: hypothetical protein VNF47_17565 [Streptosporangiaceae bacterium]|nr:hypothetical protein [Streptosporangiaceae bacterium]
MSEPAEPRDADLSGTEAGLFGTWVPAAHVPGVYLPVDLACTWEAILACRSCERTLRPAAEPAPVPHPRLNRAARLNPLPAGDVAGVVRLGERDIQTPVAGPPRRVRTLQLRLPVDVTLCIAIGRGSAGRSDRAVGLGPD